MHNFVEQTDSRFCLLCRPISKAGAPPSPTCLSLSGTDTTSRADTPTWCLFSPHQRVLEESSQEVPAGYSSPSKAFGMLREHFTSVSLFLLCWQVLALPLWWLLQFCICSFPVFPLFHSVILISQLSFCLSIFLLIQPFTKERGRTPVEQPSYFLSSSQWTSLLIHYTPFLTPLMPHLPQFQAVYKAHKFSFTQGCLILTWSIASIRMSTLNPDT